MKTLNEHNISRLIDFHQNMSYNAGIVCDSCSKEMKYLNPNVILSSYPSQKTVACCNEKCDQFNTHKYKVD